MADQTTIVPLPTHNEGLSEKETVLLEFMINLKNRSKSDFYKMLQALEKAVFQKIGVRLRGDTDPETITSDELENVIDIVRLVVL